MWRETSGGSLDWLVGLAGCDAKYFDLIEGYHDISDMLNVSEQLIS